MIQHIEEYFENGCGRCERFATPDCSTKNWSAGLAALRTICLSVDLTETVKWGHPCYMHADRNIAIIGAFRDNFRLSFFNAALMSDPDGVLEKQGPNTQHKDMFRFISNEQVCSQEDVIKRYLKEAMDYAERGIKPRKDVGRVEIPVELADALDTDPVLAEAFHALTPGRQKSYLINLNGAKQSKTRLSRIEKFRDKILAGKGATER